MSYAAAPTAPRLEHRTDAGAVLGIGTPSPRLSWSVPDADPSFVQTGYEVEIGRAGAEPRTYRVESGEQVLVPWPGLPLASREEVRVRVRVLGGGDRSGWSPAVTVEAGLLDPADWSARFITPATLGRLGMPAPILRGALDLPGGITRARLYVTAHGVYEARLNGGRVGDEELAPGWTSYPHRLRYQTHDVTELVRGGGNDLEVLIGNGWYRGRLAPGQTPARYGDRLALLAQLEVTAADGTVHVLGTDARWTAAESAVVADDLYDGQTTDLTRTGRTGDPCEEVDADLGRLVAPDGPPVRMTETRPAQRVFSAPSGATLVDFGQNLVGRVRIALRHRSPAGTEVVVRHAEVLDGGELGVRPLRTARATDRWLLAGDEDVLEPGLTFHGFRYAEVTGIPGLRAEDVSAVVLGTDLTRTGWFHCSDPALNRLHDNVVWSMRGNFLDVPTDCPQRDERLGWTGDIQIFAPTATFLYDCAGLLSSWLADLAADQQPDGSVPFVIPDTFDREGPAAAAWGDAATIVPWVLHRSTGDAGILARQLASMAAWVDRIAELAGPDRIWSGGFQFGDWLDPAAPPDDPFRALTDPDVVATAYFARSAELVALAAEVAGDEETAKRYAALADEARDAFAREYVTPAGLVHGDSQTAYSLALEFGLLPAPGQRERAGRRLAELVERAGFRIGTGFVGTPLVTDALTGAGRVDVAYRLLLQAESPSWLHPLTLGATTIWERWDSMLPDGSINPGEMTSFNHYAFGAVADWMHRTVAGLAPAEPGWRRLLVRPRPGGGLSSASARHRTPYGDAAVSWQLDGPAFSLQVEVPVGATATVYLPGEPAPVTVAHGRHAWQVPYPAQVLSFSAGLDEVR